MKWTLQSHCINGSTGEYSIRINNDDLSIVLIGPDALNKLEDIFSEFHSPIVVFDDDKD